MKSWEEEQKLEQEYFDKLDKFDPVQEELNLESSKLEGKQVDKICTAFTPAIKPEHNSPLSERTRAFNLSKWLLSSNKLKSLLLIVMLSSACGKKSSGGICPANEALPAATGAPTVLIIGDSISIGYTPTIEAALTPAYDVVHNPCNAMTSAWTAQNIDTWLASRDSFEAITWNNGLWDIADWENISDSDYAAKLHSIAQKIKAKTAHPLFILTTEVLAGTPHRENADVVNRNNIARDVMALEGIPVLDLYSVSQTIIDEHVSQDDVHYTDAGSEVLGQAVLEKLNELYGVN